MAYTINTTSGLTLATVADGTINTTSSSITLIGKNYAGYGQFLNENYVKLLENFSNTAAPSVPMNGQLWYDNAVKVLKVFTSNQWKSVSSATTGTSQPGDPVVGDMWWDTLTTQLKVYSGSLWVAIGPAFVSASAGTSGPLVETISDGSSSYVVVQTLVENTVVSILSKVAEFTPSPAIPGFATIKPGINLISSGSIADVQFTGDASNALSVNGITANQFLRSDIDTVTPFKLTAQGGLIVGSDLEISTAAGVTNVSNLVSNNDLDFYVNRAGVQVKAHSIDGATANTTIFGNLGVSQNVSATGSLTVTGLTTLQGQTTVHNLVAPNTNNTVHIGSNTLRFAEMHATTFYGAVLASPADLAERFESDAEYAVGTVVELGGEKEVTISVTPASEMVFGVVSFDPAFLMNQEAGTNATHPAIALAGRVPVRVIGTVSKGDRLVAGGNGTARKAIAGEATAFNVVGRALANKTTVAEELLLLVVHSV